MTGHPDDPASASCHTMRQVFPAAVTRAVGHYTHFSQRIPPDNAKEVAGFHTACKAALAHITALLKLEKLCGKDAPAPKDAPDDIDTLLQETRRILLTMKDPE